MAVEKGKPPSLMRGTIEVNGERCKGCALCVHFCPQKVLRISGRRNSLNHHIVELFDEDHCTGCQVCSDVCPDMAISAVFQGQGRIESPPS